MVFDELEEDLVTANYFGFLYNHSIVVKRQCYETILYRVTTLICQVPGPRKIENKTKTPRNLRGPLQLGQSKDRFDVSVELSQ